MPTTAASTIEQAAQALLFIGEHHLPVDQFKAGVGPNNIDITVNRAEDVHLWADTLGRPAVRTGTWLEVRGPVHGLEYTVQHNREWATQ